MKIITGFLFGLAFGALFTIAVFTSGLDGDIIGIIIYYVLCFFGGIVGMHLSYILHEK